MKDTKVISASVIARLPRYYRFLCELQNRGVVRISSKELSKTMGLTASQIRQDFNCFGGFGQQGYGYNVSQLRQEMAEILGLNAPKTAILIGAGNLGMAIARGMNFEDMGFRLTAVFDVDKKKLNQQLHGAEIRDAAELDDYCRTFRPDMAVLCLPEEQAAETVKLLINAGVNSFWNFSHCDVRRLCPDEAGANVHLSHSLMTLSYIMKNREDR